MMSRALGSVSLRTRLTIWYSLVLLVVSTAFGAAVVWQQGKIGMRRVDREIDAFAATLDNVLRDELSETSDTAAAAAEARRTLAAPGHAVVILDESGRALAGSLPDVGLDQAQGVPHRSTAWTAILGGESWRVHAVPLAVGERRFSLVVAAPLADLLREQREVEEAIWVGVPLVLLAAAVGGLWIASVGLRPIAEMAQRAGAIAPAGVEDLGQSERADELGQFARAFNGLVARLRHTLQTQRQFMADASHELRTPASIIQTTADVTLARASRGEAEYREALAGVAGESRRLGRLVDDMLVLARADAGGYPLRPVNLYLNELVADCGRTVEVLARERGVAIRAAADREVAFHGDENLLRRMMLNLLQNAVAHTRAGGAVAVDVSPNGRRVAIRVRDEGRGIADADRARIFDRFVQLDAARHASGTGLGLPIARWIAEIHGGTLDLEESGAAGSTFRIELPLA